jgi:transposase-like protein
LELTGSVDIREWDGSPKKVGPRPRPKYPPKFRAHAIELRQTSGKCQRAGALELGISNEVLN